MELNQEQRDGCEALALEDELYRLLILPGVGAKLASLVYKPTGRETIFRSDRPFRQPIYGGAFDAYDISGFDECFPNIGASTYPEPPWQGTGLVDHGELWCSPWEWTFKAGRLHIWTYGTRFPYRFDKWISRAGRAILLEYQVTNPAAYPLKYIWSAHPLFAARPSMRVLLPKGIRVRVDWSKDARLGSICTEHPWPVTLDKEGQEVDLSLVQSDVLGCADKFYSTRLAEGKCALYDPEREEYVGFSFSPEEIPYVGVWINQGGWPLEGKTCFHVALEPCTGYPDRLDIAILRDEYAVVSAKGTRRWSLRLSAGQATTESHVFPAMD
ncbi:MAG: aldose epimerase family protein [Anaerolineae bacterium]